MQIFFACIVTQTLLGITPGLMFFGFLPNLLPSVLETRGIKTAVAATALGRSGVEKRFDASKIPQNEPLRAEIMRK